MTHVHDGLIDSVLAKALLSQFERPMFVVDQQCGVLFANEAASALLDRDHVLGILNDTLIYKGQSSENPIVEAINKLQTTNASHNGPLRVPFRLVPLDDKPYVGVATALNPEVAMGVFGTEPRVLLTLHQPGTLKAAPDPDFIADCLGLSRAEGAVAALIAAGKSPAEIAESRFVADSTVRSQIKAIRSKLGVDRFSEIVRLVNDLPIA